MSTLTPTEPWLGTEPNINTTKPKAQSAQASGIWPENITCEMNIELWTTALTRAGLIPQFQDGLDGFARAFYQGIPDHDFREGVTHFTPPNHASALLAKEKIEASIATEISAGRMFGPYSIEKLN